MSGSDGAAPVAGVAAAVVTAGLLALLGSPRAAGYVLAATLGVLAVARAALPLSVVGPFAVRSKAVDVVVTGVLAAALAGVTYAFPG